MSGEGAPRAAPMVDPETLAIRAQPSKPIRFRRGVIVGISAVGSVSLIAVAWMALKPQVIRQVAAEEELVQPARPSADALNGLPATYGDVPKLGPPLPGDLARPIVERQRQLAAEALEPVPAAEPAVPAASEAQPARDARRAARESSLLISRSGGSATVSMPLASVIAEPVATPAKLPLGLANDPNAQQRKAEFVAALAPRGDTNPHALTTAASPYVLTAGSVISASLITGLRSDLPGLVVAQVTERVFDSPTGRTLLIPQGARLVGSYDSVVAFGQRRALIVWQRIVMPDGSSLRLENVPATDSAGYAGLEDKVDFHTWQLIKGVALSSLLGVGSQLAFTGDSDLVEAIRRSTQDNVARAGDQITQRNLNIQPTITIRPGAPVRLVVHKDLVLAPWAGGH